MSLMLKLLKFLSEKKIFPADGFSIKAIKVLPTAASNELLVSNRISFLVKDRKKFISYFQKNGVTVGKWFDGPLSPSPRSKLFNYDKKKFKFSLKISKKIVNLPCNSGMTYFDCQRIVILLNKYFLNRI